MATLKIQKVSEFVSALSKMKEYDICYSGFPKKGRQGSHISKRTHNFLTRCTSFWSIFHSDSYAIVKILGNLFWAKSKLCCVHGAFWRSCCKIERDNVLCCVSCDWWKDIAQPLKVVNDKQTGFFLMLIN